MRGEGAQERSFVGEAPATNLFAVLPHFANYFDQIVDVALRINAARNGEPDKIHLRGTGKHQSANLDRANTALQIEFSGEGDPRKLLRRNLRKESTRVEIYCMAARGLHDGHAFLGNVVAQVGG